MDKNKIIKGDEYMQQIKKYFLSLLFILVLMFSVGTANNIVKADSTNPVGIRIESWDHTVVPYKELQVKLFDLTFISGIGNSTVGNWYKDHSEPLAVHAIVQALQSEGIDVSDDNQFDINSGGNYIAGIAGLWEFDKGPLSGWMYRVNDEVVGLGVGQQTLKANDRVEVYYIGDFTNYDFGKLSASTTTIKKGQSISFKVSGQKASWDEVLPYSPIEGAIIYSNGQNTNTITNTNGEATLQFSQPGTYFITAEKRNENDHYNLVRPLPIKIIVE